MEHEWRNMSLRWIFPTPILQADLNPNESQARAMQRQLEIFDRLAYQSDSNKNQKMLTGDKLGEIGLDQLHHSSSFEWLNQQLALQVTILMNELFGNKAALDVHIQKGWPVICDANGGAISLHSHRNADLSAIFYIQTETGNDSGQLTFHAPKHFLNNYPYANEGELGGAEIAIQPKRHRLILFPSHLEHEVKPYQGNCKRYSVSYDLSITSRRNRGREMLLQHPSDWRSLRDEKENYNTGSDIAQTSNQ